MRFPFPADEAVEPVATLRHSFCNCRAVRTVAPKNDLIPEAAAGIPASSANRRSLCLVQMEKSAVENEVACGGRHRSGAGTQSAPEPEPFVDTAPRPRPKRKVIAFPTASFDRAGGALSPGRSRDHGIAPHSRCPRGAGGHSDDAVSGWTATRSSGPRRCRRATGNTWNFRSARCGFHNACSRALVDVARGRRWRGGVCRCRL